jgi:hypothetical protein
MKQLGPPRPSWHIVARMIGAVVLIYFVPKWSGHALLNYQRPPSFDRTVGMANWTGPEKADSVAAAMHDTLVMPLTCLLLWRYLVHDGLVEERNDPRLSRDRLTREQWQARWTFQASLFYILAGIVVMIYYPKPAYLPVDGLFVSGYGACLMPLAPKTRARVLTSVLRTLYVLPLTAVCFHMLWTHNADAAFELQATSIHIVGSRLWIHFVLMESMLVIASYGLIETTRVIDVVVSVSFSTLFWGGTMRSVRLGWWEQAPFFATSLLLGALYVWTRTTTITTSRKTSKQSREQRSAAEELSNWAAPPPAQGTPSMGICVPVDATRGLINAEAGGAPSEENVAGSGGGDEGGGAGGGWWSGGLRGGYRWLTISSEMGCCCEIGSNNGSNGSPPDEVGSQFRAAIIVMCGVVVGLLLQRTWPDFGVNIITLF